MQRDRFVVTNQVLANAQNAQATEFSFISQTTQQQQQQQQNVVPRGARNIKIMPTTHFLPLCSIEC